MNRAALSQARRVLSAVTAAREKAEARLARAERNAERLGGDELWDARCEAMTAYEALELAKSKEQDAEGELHHLLREAGLLRTKQHRP